GLYRLRLYSWEDDGSSSFLPDGTWVPMTDTPHSIRFSWRASFLGGGSNGRAELWVDGVSQGELTGLANSAVRIDSCRLGATAGVDPTTSGTLFLDDYRSFR
ncbi:MAG: hypothetical protein KDD47_21835, partial [Acidobacteria bacterium]|nr:hypothetical protein [Acidobacteriota bacterium]